MPLGDGISFKYGSYEFDPRPLFTVNKEVIKTPVNEALATKYSVTLEGHILPTGVDAVGGHVGGITKVFNGLADLRTAFQKDFQLLHLQCGSEDPIISGYPKVVGIDISHSDDNYIRRADYSVNLEMHTLVGQSSEPAGMDCAGSGAGDLTSHGLISLSDEFTVEFLDEKIGGEITSIEGFGSLPTVFSLQRTITAQGDPLPCTDGEAPDPAQRAKAYVTSQLGGGGTAAMTGLTGLIPIGGQSTLANNFRTVTMNKHDGSASATETWISFTGGVPAFEDFEISIDKSHDSPFTTVAINGTIQGLTSVSYGAASTGKVKFDNAYDQWKLVSGYLDGRVSAIYGSQGPGSHLPTGALNTVPLSESLGYNIAGGTVTYSRSYDDRPVNCYTGAIVETISFTYNEPNDIFAALTILGKPRGPLFQVIATSGVTTRDVAIDAIIPVQANCADPAFINPPDVYDQLVNNYETALTSSFNQVFVNSYSKSWEPKVGHFTLSKSWTVGYCD